MVVLQGKTLPPGRWPKGDHDAWERAMRDNDIFAARNVAARWSTVTRHTVAVGYSRWLGHLNQRGKIKGNPADRVTPDVVADYVAHLKNTVRPTTVYNYARHLCDAIRAMAPDQDWRDLPPFFVPVPMLVLARFLGRADPAVAHQQRRPDQSVWARWLVAPGVCSPMHCAA